MSGWYHNRSHVITFTSAATVTPRQSFQPLRQVVMSPASHCPSSPIPLSSAMLNSQVANSHYRYRAHRRKVRNNNKTAPNTAPAAFTRLSPGTATRIRPWINNTADVVFRHRSRRVIPVQFCQRQTRLHRPSSLRQTQ